jgi:hypothetical protein
MEQIDQMPTFPLPGGSCYEHNCATFLDFASAGAGHSKRRLYLEMVLCHAFLPIYGCQFLTLVSGFIVPQESPTS